MLLILLTLATLTLGCQNLIINNDSQYQNFTANGKSCQQITIDGINVKEVNITTRFMSLTIQNCAQLESVNINQLPYLSSTIISSPVPSFTITFNNNNRLKNYVINLSNASMITWTESTYPKVLQVVPQDLFQAIAVSQSNWTNMDVLDSYNYFTSISLQNMPLVNDLSGVHIQSNSYALDISNLPLVYDLSSFSNLEYLYQLVLIGLSISSLGGLNQLQQSQLVIIENMPNLNNISALSNLVAPGITWSNTPEICCPDSTSNIYSTLGKANIPSCKDCYAITSISPQICPIPCTLDIQLAYSGDIRLDTLQLYWNNNYNTICNRVSGQRLFTCKPYNSLVPQTLQLTSRLQFTGPSTSVGQFQYIKWQDWVEPANLFISPLNQLALSDAVPQDRSSDVNYATTVVWSLTGAVIGVTLIVYMIFSLPNYLDLIRTPVIKNLGFGNSLTGSRRSPLGAFFSISCIMLLVSIIITSLVPFYINNSWAVTSLIPPQHQGAPSTNYKLVLQVYPNNLCTDTSFTYASLGFSQKGVWNVTTNSDNTCTIHWSCMSCTVTSSMASLQLDSYSWETYAYWVNYSFTSNSAGLSSTISESFTTNSSTIFKGQSTGIGITTIPTIIASDTSQVIGIDFERGRGSYINQIPIQNFALITSFNINLVLEVTEYWQEVYIQSKQSSLNLLAQTFALCSAAVTFIRLIMYIIARKIYKSSSKPDVDLSIRKGTMEQKNLEQAV